MDRQRAPARGSRIGCLDQGQRAGTAVIVSPGSTARASEDRLYIRRLGDPSYA
jgi:hypothetical protein